MGLTGSNKRLPAGSSLFIRRATFYYSHPTNALENKRVETQDLASLRVIQF
jgi:hypothetical protein